MSEKFTEYKRRGGEKKKSDKESNVREKKKSDKERKNFTKNTKNGKRIGERKRIGSLPKRNFGKFKMILIRERIMQQKI